MGGLDQVTRTLRPRIWLASVAFGAFVIAGALERNLTRLHAPGVDGVGYSAIRWFLWQDGLVAARGVWSEGTVALEPFGVRTAAWIIRWHVAWDMLFVLAAGALVFLVRTHPRVVGRRWPGVLIAALALDGVGNLIELVNSWAWQAWLTIAAGVVWVLALALYGVGLAGLVAAFWRDLGDAFRRAPATQRVLGLAALVLLALPFIGRIGVQTQDIVERWFVNGGTAAVWPFVFYGAYVSVVFSMRYLTSPGDAGWSTRRVAAAVAALVIGGVVTRFIVGWGFGLLTLGLGMLLVALGSQGAAPPPDDEPVDGGEIERAWVRGAVGALPAVAVAVVLVRSFADALAVTDTIVPIRYLLLSAVGSLVTVDLAYAVCSRPARALSASDTRVLRYVLRSLAVVLVAALLLVGRSADGARVLGTYGIVFLALAAAGACAAVLRSSLTPTATPLFFRRCGFARTPVILLLVLWVMSTTFLNGLSNAGGLPINYYDARLTTRVDQADAMPLAEGEPCVELADDRPVDAVVVDRFCSWIASKPAADDAGVTPLIMVTASGGGVRAAAWTATVLDCVLFRALPDCEETGPGLWNNVFAANGASGGSVGIASVVAERLAANSDSAVPPRWIDQHLGDDALSPTLARAVAYDGLLGLFGVNIGHDRTWALEDAWSEPWSIRRVAACSDSLPNETGPYERTVTEMGLISLDADSGCAMPLLMFNGIDVATGCRVNVAPVDINAALPADDETTLDLVDNLAGNADVPLFSAAFLSARFPLVSSAGRIDGRVVAGGQVLNVVDGGYGENTGTAQVAELWSQLRHVIVAWNDGHADQRVRPVLLEIVNGEGNLEPEQEVVGSQPRNCPPEPSVVGELLRPVEAILGVEKERDRALRAELRAEVVGFTAGSISGTLVTLTMAEHPGRTLPLGWALSADTLDDLRNQLEVAATRSQLERLAAVLPAPR